MLGTVLAFQLHRGMCKQVMGKDYSSAHLHRCNVHHSREGKLFVQKMYKTDLSTSWSTFLGELTGEKQLDPSALLEFFAPLASFLSSQNKGHLCGWSSAAHTSTEMGAAAAHIQGLYVFFVIIGLLLLVICGALLGTSVLYCWAKSDSHESGMGKGDGMDAEYSALDGTDDDDEDEDETDESGEYPNE